MHFLLNQAERPSAVFAANDRMAIGAIHAIQQAGLHVPEDISVMGVDDMEVSAFQTPALTTVRQSFLEMASLCLNLLIDILEHNSPSDTQIVIEPLLVERKSTGLI
jgi:LacI family transcriptional regulator